MPASSARACRELLAHHFPSLSVERIEPLPHVGWGGDSDAWLVNGALVFRFPRTPEVAAQLAVESRLLPELAPSLPPSLPLPVPRFTYLARAADTGAPLFAGYPAIVGGPLRPETLAARGQADERAAAALGAEVGRFLAALHAFPVARARALGVEEQREPERTRDLFERVRESVYPLLAPAQRRWTDHLVRDYLSNPRLWSFEPALVHGDLSGDHILLDVATGSIAGIIDFGDVAIYDPASDFTGLARYGDVCLAAALSAHGWPPGSAATERLAFYRRRVPFIALVWRAENGDEAALREGLAALRAELAAGGAGRIANRFRNPSF